MPLALWAGLAGGLLGAAVVLLASPAELFGRVPALTGTVHAPPARVAVVDGETLLVNDMIIRLDGVLAPARGQICPGQTGDCGGAAAGALASLVRERDVGCDLVGRDPEGFARGACAAGGVALNRAQIASGWARVRQGASEDLAAAEAAARSARLGQWQGATP